MPKNSPTRVCQRCKKKINIFKEDFIKEKSAFLHVECYTQRALNKGCVIEDIESAINTFMEQVKIEREYNGKIMKQNAENSLRAREAEVNRQEYKDLFNTYLKRTYELNDLPRYIYSKIAEINSGNFNKCSYAIPYEDLLDMFKRKQKFLNDIYMKNIKKGKEMSAEQRLNYDISVIINKYESYLEWKESQKYLEEHPVQNNKELIDYKKIENSTKITENSTDILSIIDEIY